MLEPEQPLHAIVQARIANYAPKERGDHRSASAVKRGQPCPNDFLYRGASGPSA